MPRRYPFDYAVVRVVPRVDRGEFLNAGVILFSSTAAFLGARIACDHKRLKALAPGIDAAMIDSYLDSIPKVCAGTADAGPIGSLAQRARFHWLVAPRSTIIQTSPVHSGVHENLDAALDSLFGKLVRSPEK
ncbi:MAG: DUF3037 domain-containing protein [Thermoanaerobaculia bacterium]